MSATIALENGGRYGFSASNLTHVGGFQFSFGSMKALGLVTDAALGKGVTMTTIMANPDLYWNSNNKYGVSSLTDFLASPEAQNQAMLDYTRTNYNVLIKGGNGYPPSISPDSSPEDIAGALFVAHMLGATGANAYFAGTPLGRYGTQDSFGTTASKRYNDGISYIDYYIKNVVRR
jgi:hypothetical protein